MELRHRLARVSFLLPAAIAAMFAVALLAYTTADASTNGYAGQNGNADGGTFTTSLSGNEEVPSVNTDTTGNSTVSFDSNGANMHVTLSVFDGNEITQAHLHCGDDGENGPAVVTLYEDSGGTDVDGSLVSRGIGSEHIADVNCASPIGDDINDVADLAEAIEEGRIYVNVHSEQYPNGVARGQFEGDDDDDNGNDDNGSGDRDHDKDHGDNRDGNHDGSDKDKNDGNRDDDSEKSDKDHGNRHNDGHNDGKSDQNGHEDGKDHGNEDHDRKNNDDYSGDYKNRDHDDKDYGRDGNDGRDGKDGKDGDDGKDYNGNHGSRSSGSSAHASVRSFINANSNLRISVR